MVENEENNGGNVLGRLEALLFVHGEPITLKKLGEILEIGDEEVKELLDAYRAELARPERGLMLLADGDKIQLVTKKELGDIVAHFIKSELAEDLSPASLETLSLVLYLGPIARSMIEYHRGVNSSFTLRNLLLRGLVDRFPDPKRPNAYLYEPSFELLRYLGVENREVLPDYARLRELLKSPEKLTEVETTPAGNAAES